MKDLQQTVYLSALWYMFFNVHIIKKGSYIRLYTSPVVITFVYKKTLPSRL